MKCQKSKIYFGLFSLLFVSLCSVYSAHAVSDVSITLDSSNYSNYSNYTLCDSTTCPDYEYLVFECTNNPFSGVTTNYLQISIVNSVRIYPCISDISVIHIDSSLSNQTIAFNSFTNLSNFFTNGGSFKVILTNDNPFGNSSVSGDLSITSNGTYDVSSYATATVDVPETVVQGDYHDDLSQINNSILVCAAVCLVIYFFYCIYRMIISKGGQ